MKVFCYPPGKTYSFFGYDESVGSWRDSCICMHSMQTRPEPFPGRDGWAVQVGAKKRCCFWGALSQLGTTHFPRPCMLFTAAHISELDRHTLCKIQFECQCWRPNHFRRSSGNGGCLKSSKSEPVGFHSPPCPSFVLLKIFWLLLGTEAGYH